MCDSASSHLASWSNSIYFAASNTHRFYQIIAWHRCPGTQPAGWQRSHLHHPLGSCSRGHLGGKIASVAFGSADGKGPHASRGNDHHRLGGGGGGGSNRGRDRRRGGGGGGRGRGGPWVRVGSYKRIEGQWASGKRHIKINMTHLFRETLCQRALEMQFSVTACPSKSNGRVAWLFP